MVNLFAEYEVAKERYRDLQRDLERRKLISELGQNAKDRATPYNSILERIAKRTILLSIWISICLVLTACTSITPPTATPAAQLPLPSTSAATSTPPSEATMTQAAVETAVPPAPTSTVTPTDVPPTATAVSGNVPVPVAQDPVVITTGVTNVRVGPGLAYAISHQLGAGVTAPILGRNLDSS
jgi:hypothetical protein